MKKWSRKVSISFLLENYELTLVVQKPLLVGPQNLQMLRNGSLFVKGILFFFQASKKSEEKI